jgi:hypothetical protein
MGYVGFGVLAFFLGTLTVPTVSTYVDFLAREKD